LLHLIADAFEFGRHGLYVEPDPGLGNVGV
jgi:hypothetical protein